MKVKPIILCGGAGTRLFPSSYKIHPKQFIDFGGWNLFQKTLERIKSPIYDHPVISSNEKYEKIIKSFLKKYKIKKYDLFASLDVQDVYGQHYWLTFPTIKL